MAVTTQPMCKARKRVAHSYRATKARGTPDVEARAARGVSWRGLSSGDTVSAAVQTRPTTAIRSPRMLQPRLACPRLLSRWSPPSAVPCSARERPQWGAQRRPPRSAERPAFLWQSREESCALL